MEINYGPFESVLELPPGYDLGQAKAAYLNGFLRIDVPVAQAQVEKHQGADRRRELNFSSELFAGGGI